MSDELSVNVSHPTAKKKVYAHQGTWKSFLKLFYKVRVFSNNAMRSSLKYFDVHHIAKAGNMVDRKWKLKFQLSLPIW